MHYRKNIKISIKQNEVLVIWHQELPSLTHPTVWRQQALPLEIRGSEMFTKYIGEQRRMGSILHKCPGNPQATQFSRIQILVSVSALRSHFWTINTCPHDTASY